MSDGLVSRVEERTEHDQPEPDAEQEAPTTEPTRDRSSGARPPQPAWSQKPSSALVTPLRPERPSVTDEEATDEQDRADDVEPDRDRPRRPADQQSDDERDECRPAAPRGEEEDEAAYGGEQHGRGQSAAAGRPRRRSSSSAIGQRSSGK